VTRPIEAIEGNSFAGYDIMSRIGQGGMGAVYKARQPVLVRLVALKVVTPHLAEEPGYIARLHHEAAAAAKFNHPNIVQIYTAGVSEGKHFIVMEYVEGESVEARLHREGRIAPGAALDICIDVAQALRYGWEHARMIHRDVKPGNIFLSENGEVKLGDLGLAKSTAEGAGGITQAGETLGTPYYCSPEQAQGEQGLDCRSDMYSLGCTLFHMLSGRPPYYDDGGHSPLAVVLKHINEPAPQIAAAIPHCPKALAALLARMLVKDPAGRPEDYQDLLHEMLEVREQFDPPRMPSAHSLPLPARTIRTERPRALSRYAPPIILALAVLIPLLLWQPWRRGGSQGAGALSPAGDPALAQGKNLVANGNFNRVTAERKPEGWEAGENADGSVLTEGGITFLRFASANPGETYFLQNVPVPPGARKATLSVRMRSLELQPTGLADFGMLVAQRDGRGELLRRDLCCISHASREWKRVIAEVEIKPEARMMVAKLRIYNAQGTVDFTDVRIEPE
jgi:serine/threonine protein kinase